MFLIIAGGVVLATVIGVAFVSSRAPEAPLGSESGFDAGSVERVSPEEAERLTRQMLAIIDEAEARALAACKIGRRGFMERRCKRKVTNRFIRLRFRAVRGFNHAIHRYTGGGFVKLLAAGAELAGAITGAEAVASGLEGGKDLDEIPEAA